MTHQRVPVPHVIRFAVQPGDVPLEKAARRLHLTPQEFRDSLPALQQRGFPPPDPTTGMFDLQAIDEWRRRRNPALFGLTPLPQQTETPRRQQSLGERFRESAKVRRRHD